MTTQYTDPYAAEWENSDRDILAAMAKVPERELPPAPLPRRRPGQFLPEMRLQPRFTPHQPPYARAQLRRLAHAIEHVDDARPAAVPVVIPEPPVPPARGEEPPFYAETMAAHYGTGPQPVQPAQAGDALPDDGRIRGLLARLAAIAAERAEPIFRSGCEACATAADGWCRHHKAMSEESGQFRRLALTLGSADSDRDALFTVIAFANDSNEVPADPAWPGQRDQVAELLNQAEGAALPDVDGCCTDEQPCAEHARAQEAAALVGAIRDAAIDARSAAEAAALIVAVITEGGR
jgi:hypothetical protein